MIGLSRGGAGRVNPLATGAWGASLVQKAYM